VNVEDIYPLSPLQQGLLFETLNSPGSGVYVGQFCWDLDGTVHADAMHEAWQAVVDRHPALRTGFIWEDTSEPHQLVERAVSVPWEEADWRASHESTQEERLRALFADDRAKGFDLANPPLTRLRLIRVAESRWKLFWSHHHLILDGWSLPILMADAARFYNARLEGRRLDLDPPPPYSRHIAWLKSRDVSAARAFWRRALDGVATSTRLAVDAPRVAGLASPDDIQYCDRYLSETTTQRLDRVARQQRITLNTLIGGAWGLLVARYTDQSDVVFGATVAGRPSDLARVEQMVGLFTNTVPVRFETRRDDTVLDCLTRLQTWLSDARAFEYVSLRDVHGWRGVSASDALFDNVFAFERYPVAKSDRSFAGIRVGSLTARTTDAYPVTAVAMPGSQLRLHLSYDRRLFDAAVIGRMMDHWERLLLGLVDEPNRRVDGIEMLTPAERTSAMARQGPDHSTEPPAIPATFEAYARRTPDVSAVWRLDETVTYGELNHRANQLARHLRHLGVGRESRVAVCLERGAPALIAKLGVLKAGAAFVPLDADYPPGRLAYMLEDSRVATLITESTMLDNFAASWLDVVCIDLDWDVIAANDGDDLALEALPGNAAYIIYTSGSTGRPKGVLIEHRSLSSLVASQLAELRIGLGTRVVHTLSFAFDASITTWITTLTAGGTLVLPPAAAAFGADLHRWMQWTAAEVLSTVPGVLQSLGTEGLSELRTISIGGETCTPDLVARWASGRRMANVYGATECTVLSTVAELSRDAPITVGAPRAGARIRVLDRSLRLLPVGVVGEVYIGGDGVGRGYVNRPGLTAQRFVADPSGPAGTRLYRTGDLGRWRDDGSLEFLGRDDDQVKIRGFRVEPAEIEAVLRSQDGVADAIAVAENDGSGSKRLVAYVVRADNRNGQMLDLALVEQGLRRELPAFMIPASLVILDALPRTTSGKVDRIALSSYTASAPPSAEGEPRTAIEEILCLLFAKTLGIDRVGTSDNFFDLGGHSLRATQLVSQVRRTFGVELELRKVFETPTVSALSRLIESLKGHETGSIPPPVRASRGDHVPTSW